LSGALPQLRVDEARMAEAPEFHPKRSACVTLRDRTIGLLGELHPDVARSLELEGRPVWAVIEIDSLTDAIRELGPPRIVPLPRFPSATRDVAVVVAEPLAAGEVADALLNAAGPQAEAVTLFDIYRGDPVPSGQKSLAFHVVYRDPEATMTDKLVDELHARVVRVAEQRFGGSIRR
jgi:phenylalanyl-tRNA synthetase beta chain